MTIQEFRDEVIRRGIKSVHKHETREHRKRGCLHGFGLATKLDPENPNEWEVTLRDRAKRENEIITERSRAPRKTREYEAETYWEYRCATLQVEHVYERLKVAWHQAGVRYADSLSARAGLQYAEIVGTRP